MLKVGNVYQAHVEVTPEKVAAFAEVSGDFNPIHVDEKAAKESIFERRIAHGMLSASFISAVLANKFPGPGSIYLSQTLKFLKPIEIHEVLQIKLEVQNVLEAKRRAVISTQVIKQNGELAIDGEAQILLP